MPAHLVTPGQIQSLQQRALGQLRRADLAVARGPFSVQVTNVERIPLGFRATYYVKGPQCWRCYARDRARFDAMIRRAVDLVFSGGFRVRITGTKHRSVEFLLELAIADPVAAIELMADVVRLLKAFAELGKMIAEAFASSDNAAADAALEAAQPAGWQGWIAAIAALLGLLALF